MRPTQYLGSKGKQWTRVDRVLAEGLLTYEASLNAHGIPWDRASDPDRKFVIDEAIDYAAQVYDEAVEEYRKGDDVEKGLRLVVVDQGLREN